MFVKAETQMTAVLKQIAYCSFYLAVIIEVLIVIVNKSAYTNPIEGRLFQITFLLFTIKTALTKYSWKEYLVIFLFLLLGSASYFITERNEIIRVVMFIASCKDVDMYKCLKLVFYMTLAGCIVIILLAATGIYGAISLQADFGRGSIETRYTLGLGHPNALQCMVWALTTLGLYLYSTKMRWIQYVYVLFVNIIFYLISGSKTGLIAAVYTILAFFIVSVIKKERLLKLFAAWNIGIYVCGIIASIFIAKDAMCLWDNSMYGIYVPKVKYYMIFDRVLTGRIGSLIETKSHAGTMQTWSLFSSPGNTYYFDLGWVRLYYWYGIIPASIAIIVLTLFLFWLYKKGKWEEIVLISAFALYTVFEAHAVSVYLARNYVLFIIGMYWYRLECDKREKTQ